MIVAMGNVFLMSFDLVMIGDTINQCVGEADDECMASP